jgi:hypothetical protein
VEPIENFSTIHVKPATKAGPGGNGGRKPPTTEPGKERDVLSGIAFPKITNVSRDQWDKYTPKFDEYSSLRIVDTGEINGNDGNEKRRVYDFYINIDNTYLRNELKYSKKNSNVLQARFRIGLVLIGLGMLQQHIEKRYRGRECNGTEESDSWPSDIEDRVEEFSKAVTPILLPMIEALGALDEEELEVAGDFGEDI